MTYVGCNSRELIANQLTQSPMKPRNATVYIKTKHSTGSPNAYARELHV